MKREIVSTLVVVLFFGLALAPSINADVGKQDDLVDLDVEFCGLDRKHTVKLTQDEYDEVELIFEDMHDKLSEVDSDDEAIDIFNEAIVKLDKYGLLGGLSVKQAQRLILSYKLNAEFIEKISNRYKELSYLDIDLFCFVAGHLTNLYSFHFPTLQISIFIKILGQFINDYFLIFTIILLQLIFNYLSFFISNIVPASLFSLVCAGYGRPTMYGYWTYPSEGWLFEISLLGNWEGLYEGAIAGRVDYINYIFLLTRGFLPLICGFTGLKVTNIINGDSLFLGMGLAFLK